MPRVVAQPQNIFANVGGPQAPRQGIDLPGAIDSLASGASSLIHNAYLRKVADRDYTERQQATEEARQYRTAELARQTAKDAQEEAFRRQEADRKFVLGGGILEHDIPASAAQSVQLAPVAQPSRIQAAYATTAAPISMTSPGAGATAQSPIARAIAGPPPIQRGADTSAPAVPPFTFRQAGAPPAHIPESVDPTQGATLQREMAAIAARGEQARITQDNRPDRDPATIPGTKEWKAAKQWEYDHAPRGSSLEHESPELTSTRKDLSEKEHQQVRSEKYKGDLQRSLTAGLKAAPTADDSSRVRLSFAPKIKLADGDIIRQRQQADSIGQEIARLRRPGAADAPAAAAAPVVAPAGARTLARPGAAPEGAVSGSDAAGVSTQSQPMRTRHPMEAADDAEQMIRNGKATFDQAMASPRLSPEAKAVLRRRFAVK